ncbi:MAG TPA: MBOAT family O-acyltransferase [Phototrophicaceae bacterium]|nr:MBOAT family O-acyltransferase [Phototrophicaceae bacterium]
MTFDLTTIALFVVGALIYAAVLPRRWRGWALLIASTILIYRLQPPLAIRFSDFILPTATVALTVACWWFTRDPSVDTVRDDRLTFGVIALLVLAMSLMRFVDPAYRLTASRPPDPILVVISLALVTAIVLAASLLVQRSSQRGQKRALWVLILVIVVLFVLLKSAPLATDVAALWRGGTGQDVSLASATDLDWLGFSYVAFRLIHTIRDRQNGILPAVSLREYVTYVIFAPAYTAGPIDRIERFTEDFRALPDKVGLDGARFMAGFTRIVIGIFKKFVIADSLAMGMALNPTNAAQTHSTVGMWLLLYGYALRLYFDFGGYSDVAIGIGILLGIKLPENFNRPYLRTNITVFWQNWHATLSAWARSYIFSPLSRWLLSRKPKPSPTMIVLLTQTATMVTIGMWHGISLNFLIWGIWHGIGLFVHKQWTDRTRKWYRSLNDKPRQKWTWTVAGWFITFHFVVLGWVWFALPTLDQSLHVFGGLFGIGL